MPKFNPSPNPSPKLQPKPQSIGSRRRNLKPGVTRAEKRFWRAVVVLWLLVTLGVLLLGGCSHAPRAGTTVVVRDNPYSHLPPYNVYLHSVAGLKAVLSRMEDCILIETGDGYPAWIGFDEAGTPAHAIYLGTEKLPQDTIGCGK